MRTHSSYGTIRALVLLANIFGLIVSAIPAVFVVFLLIQSLSSNVTNEMAIKLFEGNSVETVGLILGVALAFSFGQLIATIYIIKFIKTSSDEELSANRYVLAVLSFGAGGFFTPMILSRMENVDIESTLKPKIVISRAYGIGSIFMGVAILMGFFAINSMKSKIGENIIVSEDALTNLGVNVASIVGGVLIGWGIISTIVFYNKGITEAFEEKKGIYGFAMVIAVVNLLFASLLLILQIIYAVMELLSVFSRMFQSKGNNVFLSMMNVLFSGLVIIYYVYLIRILSKTLVGIWSGSGVKIGSYAKLAEKQARVNNSGSGRAAGIS